MGILDVTKVRTIEELNRQIELCIQSMSEEEFYANEKPEYARYRAAFAKGWFSQWGGCEQLVKLMETIIG